MRVIFMGRGPVAVRALHHLIDAGAEVPIVVAPIHPSEPIEKEYARPLLGAAANALGLKVVPDDALYQQVAEDGLVDQATGEASPIDLVLSFLFWKRIRRPLIDLPAMGCFNFHPGPLPLFRGRRGYNFAILEGHPEYGASVHWVTESFDTGDLVEVRRFPISPHETALSLRHKTLEVLLEMFDDFIANRLRDLPIARTPQGPGQTATKRELLDAARIRPDDPPDLVERKVRAFWHPPFTGATIDVNGVPYTLVDAHTLSVLGQYLHGSREAPW